MYLLITLRKCSLPLGVKEADLVSMFLHAKNHFLLTTDEPNAPVWTVFYVCLDNIVNKQK